MPLFISTDFKPGDEYANPRKFKISFEECVRQANPECRFYPGLDMFSLGIGGQHTSQIMFFCGHSQPCRYFSHRDAFK